MEGHTIEEAAILLKQSADYLRNKILFAGQAHPILKPCVFFSEPISLRIINSYGKINEYGVDHVRKTVPVPCSDGRTRSCSYDSANLQGLFELTFFPEHFDMSEAKESGRIQLYRAKAVFAGRLADFSIDMAVGWMMNGWQHFNELKNKWEPLPPVKVSKTKSHVRGKIGEIVVLTQNGIHYLVDAPVSIPLSDIRITDKMLTEYATSEGIEPQSTFDINVPNVMPASAKLPVPQYISVSDAAGILGIHVDSIKFYILQFYLTAYISGREAEPFGEITEHLAETGDIFFRFKKPIRWLCSKGIKPQDSCTVHYSKVLLKQSQILELKHHGTTAAFESHKNEPVNFDKFTEQLKSFSVNLPFETNKEQQVKTTKKSIEAQEYATQRRDEGERKEVIAYELKQKYGDALQWHEIARFAAPEKKYTEAQEKAGNPRKTGQRWAMKGKKLKEMTSS
jgi:hypothetical protein